MKIYKKLLCLVLSGAMLLAAGCSNDANKGSVNVYDENNPAPTEAPVQEIQGELGQSAEVGGMTLTVLSVEDPNITMEKTGKQALFFHVTIDNKTDGTVTANYLNNFSLTVDGTYYSSDVCCTIPVMKELYDFYGTDAMTEEIPAGESRTGYIACEADKGFESLSLHYTPKTTDRESKITVTVDKSAVVEAKK